MKNKKNLKSVFSSFNECDITLAKSYLLSEGIESFVIKDAASSVIPAVVMLTEGISLSVHENDYEQACKLIDEKLK